MNALAVDIGKSLSIKQFDIAKYFHTETFLFKKLILTNNSLEFIEWFFALILFIIFIPLYVLVCALISFTMKGPIFYSQVRIGKEGRIFKIYKFRSMIENAEANTGPVLSCANDHRVTKFGAFLRASHLDEIPQLLNILKGDMSFVGPRPERPEFVSCFENEIKEYKRRREVKPGITGLAQICLPYNATAAEKLEYDLFFIEHRNSIYFLIIIVFYTAMKMLTFYKN